MDQKKADRDLKKAFSEAIQSIGAPEKDDDEFLEWLKKLGLDRLQAPKSVALRRQVALALVGYTDPQAEPPPELVLALGWPHSRIGDLKNLLVTLRQSLAGSPEWKPLIDFANDAEKLGQLIGIITSLEKFERTLVQTPEGQAFRVVIAENKLTELQAAVLELEYLKRLQAEFEYHQTQGLSASQLPAAIQLDLKYIYQELSLYPMRSEQERQHDQELVLQATEKEPRQRDQSIQKPRVSGAIAENQRLVIAGLPGSGKTISLKFIALMLTYGAYGASRLRLDKPYVPIFVSLRHYAEKLKDNSSLALEAFLRKYINDKYSGEDDLEKYLQLALKKGQCMILLDGLDEVGYSAENLQQRQNLHDLVIHEVQRFADVHCKRSTQNRIIVTSRLEGYQRGSLAGFTEMELDYLAYPEEVEDFLVRWFYDYALNYQKELQPEQAYHRANAQVEPLMADIDASESIQRLAINPLLLTLLAMVKQTGTPLPERRVELYSIVASILIKSWLKPKVSLNLKLAIYERLTPDGIMDLMAALAYWLHENKLGGTMPEEEWRKKISSLLEDEFKHLFQDSRSNEQQKSKDINDLTDLFMLHAQQEVGLLVERSPAQIGFFHLTLEEYLAAYDMACQDSDERCQRIEKHWKDPNWREVLMLTAGQLQLNRNTALFNYISDLRTQDTVGEAKLLGRPALLAGWAVKDVGIAHFQKKRKVFEDVRDDLKKLMQDIDPDTGQLWETAHVPIDTRAEAADTLDALGYLPPDLPQLIHVQQDKLDFWMGKYPVTNAQYERFLQPENFANPKLWLDFPKLNPEKPDAVETWGDEGWQWLQRQEFDDTPQGKVILPRSWRDPRFGIARRGAPVVGVTWWEAMAYCRWLREHWSEQDEGRVSGNPPSPRVRLPLEAEWIAAAGGEGEKKDRYPWSTAANKYAALDEVLQRANVRESGINRTTPVSVFPQGVSQPWKVMDMGGNVWEWQVNLDKPGSSWLALRGGSWGDSVESARVAARIWSIPDFLWSSYVGFRLVCVPI